MRDWLCGIFSTDGLDTDVGKLLELLADKVLGELLPLVPIMPSAAAEVFDGAMDSDNVAACWAVAGLEVLLGDMLRGETESVS